MLVSSDQGIALYRKLLQQQLEEVANGNDPMGVYRDQPKDFIIELQQEKNKFGAGDRFLREALEMSHVRYSPIKEDVINMLDLAVHS
jgi:5,5'-dehydrodivanillate O-demethylase